MFVRAVHSVASAVKAVVGDGRSGDPLHERDDKRDVYEGEVAMVDSVSELVRRVDGVVVIMFARSCPRASDRAGRTA